MEIKVNSKFKFGDELYYIKNKRISSFIVYFIQLEIDSYNICVIHYSPNKWEGKYDWHSEDEVFGSKDDLIQNLLKY